METLQIIKWYLVLACVFGAFFEHAWELREEDEDDQEFERIRDKHIIIYYFIRGLVSFLYAILWPLSMIYVFFNIIKYHRNQEDF